MQDRLKNGPWFPVTDWDAVDLRHGHHAVRCAADKCFVCVDDVVDLEVAFSKGDLQLGGQVDDGLPADPWENIAERRRNDLPLFDDEEIGSTGFSDVAIEIQQKWDGCGVDLAGFLFSQIVVHATSVFHFGVVALWWDMPDGRRHDMRSVLHPRCPQFAGQGEGVGADGGGGLGGGSGTACVRAVLSGGDKGDQSQFVCRLQEGCIVLDQFFELFLKLRSVDSQVEANITQRTFQTVEMGIQPKQLLVKGAHHFCDRCTQDDAGVIDLEVRLGIGNEFMIQVGERFGHRTSSCRGEGGLIDRRGDAQWQAGMRCR